MKPESITRHITSKDLHQRGQTPIAAEWLSEHKDEIELFFTSPYSPEINPDEYLNHSLKKNIHSGIIPHTKKQIWRKTEKFMIGMQECQEKPPVREWVDERIK